MARCCLSSLFFFNDPATPEISPLPLHDALPISPSRPDDGAAAAPRAAGLLDVRTLGRYRRALHEPSADRVPIRLGRSPARRGSRRWRLAFAARPRGEAGHGAPVGSGGGAPGVPPSRRGV